MEQNKVWRNVWAIFNGTDSAAVIFTEGSYEGGVPITTSQRTHYVKMGSPSWHRLYRLLATHAGHTGVMWGGWICEVPPVIF